jgi:hypothetical protein
MMTIESTRTGKPTTRAGKPTTRAGNPAQPLLNKTQLPGEYLGCHYISDSLHISRQGTTLFVRAYASTEPPSTIDVSDPSQPDKLLENNFKNWISPKNCANKLK